MKELLKLKKKMKVRKPSFIRQDAHKWKRLGNKWRKPTGIHSKVRQKIIGHPVMVNRGYGTPKAVYGMLQNGLLPIRVFNVNDLSAIDSKTQTAVIASTVGLRKKIKIVAQAQKDGIKIANLKDVVAFQESVKKQMEAIKNAKQAEIKEEKKETKKQQKQEKKEEKKEDSKEEKEAQRREAEKVLIQK